MIKEVSGDILLTEAQAIAHGVAPHDHFNTGLALSLRKNYPAMYKDFRHHCRNTNPAPGEVWTWAGAAEKSGIVRIANLLTQEPAKGHEGHPGRADLSHVSHALKDLAKWIKKEKIESIALPRLATGVGGLDWEDVKKVIHNRLGELDIPVYVYVTYHAGEKAAEN